MSNAKRQDGSSDPSLTHASMEQVANSQNTSVSCKTPARKRAYKPDAKIVWPELAEVNRKRFEKLLKQPAPNKEYTLFFTARSGSSRLNDILLKTDRMGKLGEAYNPANVPGMSRALGATNLDEYVNVIRRFKQSGRVCGTDVTYSMIDYVFGGPKVFMSYFGKGPAIWLIREDIVLQAISLYKLTTTKVAHSVSSSQQEQLKADQKFSYNARQIKKWLGHLRSNETRTENLFMFFGVQPLRLSYEELSAVDDTAIARSIARFLEIDLDGSPEIKSDHKKLGTEKNQAFADRFRAENADFVQAVEQEREQMCAAIARGYCQ